MAEVITQIKKIWIKSMETVGNTASSIANNTKFKVDEMNLQNHRREIIANIGSVAYVLFQRGERFPEEIQKQLEEIQRIDEALNDMRAERYSGKTAAQPETAETENAGEPETAEPEKASEPKTVEAETPDEIETAQPEDGAPVRDAMAEESNE